jgi:SAM-dependent methyltransferase
MTTRRRSHNAANNRARRAKKADSPAHPDGQAAQPYEFDYVAFEQTFRGPVTAIKERQEKYLPFFLGRTNVADLGCGRGEFVALLCEQGVNASGVDLNKNMAQYGRDQGLPIVDGDMFHYLAGLPDRALDGVFVAQVVEHLAPVDVGRLIALCARKLAPGGVLVAETINPNCPAALANFFLDPTHVRPVPALLLGFMCTQGGFTVERTIFSAPTTPGVPPILEEAQLEWQSEASPYQDYAVVAVRQRLPQD